MTIDPLLPLWLTVVLLTCLFVWSTYIEWRRPLRFRILRLIACLVAVLALAVIFMKPSLPSQNTATNILLTSSYSPKVADSLRRAMPGATFYHLGAQKYRNSKALTSYRQLLSGSAATEGERLSTIAGIVGDGLPSYALDSLGSGFFYLPSPLRDGITELSVPRELQRNKTAILQGSFQTSRVPAWLKLAGPSGKLDSIQLQQKTGTFKFEFTPRVSGKLKYSLTLADSSGSLITEQVPLNVDAFVPLNILILQYPTFELSHLKNYLADRGHLIAVRAELSRNIYRTEFANRPARALNPITPSLLDEFDLLIADPTMLAQMPAKERNAIVQAMRNGLGTLIPFDGAPRKFPPQDLLPATFAAQAADTVSITLHGRRLRMPATRLNPTNFTGTAVSKDKSRILSGTLPVREGAAGFQLLRETYALLLAGDSVGYGALWSPLIDATARARTSVSAIELENSFPLHVNEPVSVTLTSSATPTLLADSTSVPVIEDPLIDGLWHATVWPGEIGWHELGTQTDTTSYYVFDDSEWKTLRTARKQDENRIASARTATRDIMHAVSKPMPLMIFWIVFLLAIGFVWLAPKL